MTSASDALPSHASLVRAWRALRVTRAVANAQRVATSEHELMREVCRLIVEDGGYRLAWIGEAVDDREHSVRPVAQSGFEDGYLERVQIRWSDEPLGRGPTGLAIRTGVPAVARDIVHDANFALWRDEAIRRGFASSIALPLEVGDRRMGALSIYAAEPDAFDADEQTLLFDLATTTAQAIAHLRTQAERERAIEALRESEERFREIADNIDDIFWIFTPDMTRLLYVSRRLQEITGVPVDRYYEDFHEFTRFIHPDDLPNLRPMAGSPPGQFQVEYRVRFPAVGERWLSVRGYPVRDASGVTTRVVGITEDISDRKRSEEQRLRLEAELSESRRLEGLGRLAGGVAHDFNNLLGVIMNYAAIAGSRLPKDDPVRSELTGILDTAEHAARLTRQLVLFSREAHAPAEIVDVNASITGLERVLSTAAGERIRIVTDLAPELPPTRIVPAHLEQILLNLVVNARDALDGSGTVTVTTSRIDLDGERIAGMPAGPYVRLSVTDTGRGMTESQVDRAFDPFYSTKESGEGLGLGLAIVYGAVKQAGGQVSIQSAVDRGTRVDVYLPAALTE